MTEQEQRRVWRRENGKLNGIIGGLFAVAIALGGYALTNEQRLSTIEQVGKTNSEQLEVFSTRLEKTEDARAADSEAVIRIEERLAAQSDSIRRIETSLGELVRYLRERDLPQPR